MNLQQRDQRSLGRDVPPEDLQVARADRSFLFDAKVKKYIDFFSGWCAGNLGWNNKEIKEAIKRFNGPPYVAPGYLYEPWAELADLLAEITPGNLKISFRAVAGTEAVEIALQLAQLHTKRRKFVAIEDSYHGNSIAALSIASSDAREPYRNLLSNCYKIRPPLDTDRLNRVETLLKRRDVAAFIMEPIICNLGVLIPEREFMVGLRRLCSKYGSVLIADEVATGFGRTGKLFASEHFDLQPDIMCMAKAVTGAMRHSGRPSLPKKSQSQPRASLVFTLPTAGILSASRLPLLTSAT